MDTWQSSNHLNAPGRITELLRECGTIIDYHILCDSLPQRLSSLFHCRCVQLYLQSDDALHRVASVCDGQPQPPMAASEPIRLDGPLPEVDAWRERRTIVTLTGEPERIITPLIYRQRCIGVLVMQPGPPEIVSQPQRTWPSEEIATLEAVAGVVALLLEHARLLEQDRRRIHELSLLNSISSQMNASMDEIERLHTLVIQRTREITEVECCALVMPSTPDDAISWITPALRDALLNHCQVQHTLDPLIIERPAPLDDPQAAMYLNELPTRLKTFFMVPLLSVRLLGAGTIPPSPAWRHVTAEAETRSGVLGMIIGGSSHPLSLHHSERALLQVLASQASAVLEHRQLLEEVLAARNEARRLLRQVLDDRRVKEMILEHIPSGLITTNLRGRITTFNRAAATILGYHPYEMLGQPLHKFFDLHSPLVPPRPSPSSVASPIPLSPLPDALPPGTHAGPPEHTTIVTSDRYERERVLEGILIPLHDELGKRIGTLLSFNDMTSVHRLEEEKRQLDRLASLGEMAANVAHEVRNPLASIKTSIQLLRDDLRADGLLEQADAAQESIAVTLKEVERLDAIVRDLLLFARPRQVQRTRCNILELIDHVLKFLQPQCLEATIEIHRVYEPVPPLLIDAAQIEQVLLNLAMNALQAMPDGGILTIACHPLPGEQAIRDYMNTSGSTTRLIVGQPAGGIQSLPGVTHWLEVVVNDTGTGIAYDQLSRLFQPFYTTKAHGIGLGLPITRRLVEDHGGYLCIESQLGYGAIIAMRIPLLTNEQPLRENQMEEERGTVP